MPNSVVQALFSFFLKKAKSALFASDLRPYQGLPFRYRGVSARPRSICLWVYFCKENSRIAGPA
jgi:hypothetical protein